MPKQHLTAVVGANTKGFNRAMGSMNGGIKRVGVAMAAVAAAGAAALVKATKQAIEYGDSIDKASKRTGIAAESLQRYQLAADLSGASMQDLEKAMKRSASVILDTQNGLMESKRAMDALGLSADELADKTPEQQLDAFLEALADVESHSKRAALAQDIFGRAGTNLLPILSKGADGYRELIGEADKFNTILSQDAVTAAAEAKDGYTRLQASLKALTFGVILEDGMAIADTLNSMAASVSDFIESGGIQQLSDIFSVLQSHMKAVLWVMGKIMALAGFIGKTGESIVGGALLTSTGQQTAMLKRGTGDFGAASEKDLILAMMRMATEQGVKVRPAGVGV